MKNRILLTIVIMIIVMNCSNINRQEKEQSTDKKTLIASRHFSGFDLAHDTYNAISAASDGNVYTLARFEHEGNLVEDLVKIPNPFK